MIQNERGDILRRNSIAVTETRKKANPDYKPLTDVIVGKGEILVNRKESAKAVIEKQEGLLIVDTASRATVLSADSIGGMLIVEKQNESSAYRPILLKLVLMKVKGKGFCNVFTYEDLVTNGVHPQESVVSVNGTLKLSYAVGKGKYLDFGNDPASLFTEPRIGISPGIDHIPLFARQSYASQRF